jgi:hypothetical protein
MWIIGHPTLIIVPTLELDLRYWMEVFGVARSSRSSSKLTL